VYAEALDRTVVRAAGPWSEFLKASSCIRIRRRINVANEFDCLSEYYIDADKFAPVLELPFQELHRVIIRNLLAKHFNAPVFSFSQRIYATEFPARIRSLLKVPKSKGYGMVLEINSYTHHQAAISFQNIFIPAGVRRLEIPSPNLRYTS
jgi:DNA-binding GntR family transcriptional regulator